MNLRSIKKPMKSNVKLILGIVIVVFRKYLNSAVDKTINTVLTFRTYCNTNYRIILLMMLFITSWCIRPI